MDNLTLISYGIASICLTILCYTYFIAFLAEKDRHRKLSVLSFLLLFCSSFLVALAIVVAQGAGGTRLPFAEYRGLFLALSTVFLLYTSLRKNK